jgi:ABC-type polysaccharide/polyol phosphate export permease
MMANVRGLYAIWLREIMRAMRDRGQTIGGVSRPLIWLLILGIGLNPYFRGEAYGEVRFVILSFGLTSFGVILANRVRSFEGFGVFSNTVIRPVYFASSSVFPLDPALSRAQTSVVYPEFLVALVRINPMTYAADALRGVLIGFHQFTPMLGPLIIAGMAFGFFALALWDFRRP